jgi:hypothetical protein
MTEEDWHISAASIALTDSWTPVLGGVMLTQLEEFLVQHQGRYQVQWQANSISGKDVSSLERFERQKDAKAGATARSAFNLNSSFVRFY